MTGGGRRWRTRALALALISLAATLVLPGGSDDAVAAGIPGRSAWVETVDRGDTFRLVVTLPSGPTVLAPHVYGRPAFSPDGTQVAYTAPVTDASDGRWALFAAQVDGTQRRRLTSPRVGDFFPAWSPDGKSIVVSRDERGSFEPSCCTLWVVAADGSGERRLSHATSATQPAISPDGGTVAYTTPSGVALASLRDSGTRGLLTGAYGWPTFSPDGTTVAAVRRTGPSSGTIDLVPFTGGSPVPTAAGSGGGLPEAPVFETARDLLHLSTWGEGENGRTAAEVRRTTVGQGTSAIYRTGRPMHYFAWTPGKACTPGAPPPPPAADRPEVARLGAWFLRASLSSGGADACFNYANATGDRYLTGDWDGDGTRTPGVFRSGRWYLRDDNSDGAADRAFLFGNPGDVPVVGDWDGDGTDTVGVFRQGVWYARDSNSAGPHQRQITFASPGDLPVALDWDGDGIDTPAVLRDGRWFMRRTFSSGAAQRQALFGRGGDVPVVGDWDGDGADGLGVFRGGRWYVTDASSGTPAADASFVFGQPGDQPLRWR